MLATCTPTVLVLPLASIKDADLSEGGQNHENILKIGG
ncbi:hypothetical protein Agau_L100068 [Agrobacterium tumefaciens F2]|nr:hypothetical protein Agau_L100068 [Agrobacterium tumefaciens F2]